MNKNITTITDEVLLNYKSQKGFKCTAAEPNDVLIKNLKEHMNYLNYMEKYKIRIV